MIKLFAVFSRELIQKKSSHEFTNSFCRMENFTVDGELVYDTEMVQTVNCKCIMKLTQEFDPRKKLQSIHFYISPSQ
jgi:hypothetical protein